MHKYLQFVLIMNLPPSHPYDIFGTALQSPEYFWHGPLTSNTPIYQTLTNILTCYLLQFTNLTPYPCPFHRHIFTLSSWERHQGFDSSRATNGGNFQVKFLKHSVDSLISNIIDLFNYVICLDFPSNGHNASSPWFFNQEIVPIQKLLPNAQLLLIKPSTNLLKSHVV